jgi:hypothetical protein
MRALDHYALQCGGSFGAQQRDRVRSPMMSRGRRFYITVGVDRKPLIELCLLFSPAAAPQHAQVSKIRAFLDV